MTFKSFAYLIPFFLIPFVVFVLIPRLSPLFRKLQRYFSK
ncbi:hypothetical protein Despr_0403 [Desulfobulbus propionicus DSM 2032]|uniref:Uncharacterized protein n=1 Tax=Desulfobulbus propionicus (strain ATCC 33891 / DSM 2032 / VKM B-1956 / 1pr3) TaxID=577650 RepID=A0A7U3YJQ6_DESPD|nr:hypothetical protein Despr_0403 [Desulfobulbus propionicus DSM 2032]